MRSKLKRERKIRRKRKIRSRIFGTEVRPRLSVYRSLKHIYAQLIDDENEVTLAAASDLELKKSKISARGGSAFGGKSQKLKVNKKETKEEKKSYSNKVAIAYEVGKLIAQKALKKKIKKIVFDRGSFLYHGRIKALADGARIGGLEF